MLGQALKHLRQNDPKTAARVPEIDRIVGMRNVIAHEYRAIDYSILWMTVTTRVPAVRHVLDELLREAGPVPDTADAAGAN